VSNPATRNSRAMRKNANGSTTAKRAVTATGDSVVSCTPA
jgi:hypothetical protein